MAKRYIYYIDNDNKYHQELIDFKWFPGLSKSQYKRSSFSLISAFNEKHSNDNLNVLEISTASDNHLGIKCSAFNLRVIANNSKVYTVEQIFQAAKYFDGDNDKSQKKRASRILDKKSSYSAKKLARELGQKQKLVKFRIGGKDYPLCPQTSFYNWVYINVLHQHKELAEGICKYQGFSDIYFNPKRSINTQAEACARYVFLVKTGLLDHSLDSFDNFVDDVYESGLKKS